MEIVKSGCLYRYRDVYGRVRLDHTLRTGARELDPVMILSLHVHYLVLCRVIVWVLEDGIQRVVMVNERPLEIQLTCR